MSFVAKCIWIMYRHNMSNNEEWYFLWVTDNDVQFLLWIPHLKKPHNFLTLWDMFATILEVNVTNNKSNGSVCFFVCFLQKQNSFGGGFLDEKKLESLWHTPRAMVRAIPSDVGRQNSLPMKILLTSINCHTRSKCARSSLVASNRRKIVVTPPAT